MKMAFNWLETLREVSSQESKGPQYRGPFA